MALGKYYCDYCDKQFQDTPSARKRHLLGLQHIRAKAQWYHSHQDPNQTYTGASAAFAKGLCNRFLKTGFCQYGDSCKYFHPNNNNDNPQNSVTQGVVATDFPSNVPRSQSIEGTSLPGVVRDSMGMSWGNLPPSLKPPPEGGYPPLPFVDWG